MPRQARLDAPGALHHVMIRGIEGTAIFRNGKDREDFLARVGRIVEAGALSVYAWKKGTFVPKRLGNFAESGVKHVQA